MIDHQYLNIITKSIIDNETGESIEYSHIMKRDKHKNKWVEYFPMIWDSCNKGQDTE